MPYKHRKVGNKYCVYKKDGGEKVGCTKGSKEALRKYLAALHIAEDELEIRQESVGNFKTFFENSQIESLEAMIANPDPERVKMYGGTEYVDMLKKKLERAKKVQAIQSHLKNTPLGRGIEDGESEDLEQQILDLIDQGKKEEAKELNFKMYDIDPDKYKELYYKITGKEEDGEALERLTRQDHPGMVKYRDKDLPKLSKGAQNTLSRIYDKINKDKEEDAQDRCKRKADQVYGKKTSAYKSGAIVRCRKGKIWKKK